ncbi:twin-arginine translocation signal domain-containing protein [Chloroflexi bacterium TSY]|nr:twin-arginine translocation signal domain-containing protein [Chloroflexi bacterium TSY]
MNDMSRRDFLKLTAVAGMVTVGDYVRSGPVAMQPQLLVRYGYAQAMPKSLRRPVEEVLM